MFRGLLVFLFAMFFAGAAFSKEVPESPKRKDVIILPAGAVHKGDFFAWGRSVEISGKITGDLYVMAPQVFIDGEITGDVLGVAGSAEISGRVGLNVRLLSGQLFISGNIGKNVSSIGGSLQITQSAIIGENLVTAAGNVDVGAKVKGDATLLASNLRFSGEVFDNMEAYVGHMRFTSRAIIGGNLDYSSRKPAVFDKGVVIEGDINYNPSSMQEFMKGRWVQGFVLGSKLITIIMNVLYSFVIGIFLIKVFPDKLRRVLAVLQDRPWWALFYGTIIIVVLPLAALLLLVTIIGIPFALTVLTLNVLGLYTAKVFSVIWISNRFFPTKPNRLITFSLGLVIYFLLAAIPFAGRVVSIAATLFGLGGAALSWTKGRDWI